jgi:hypothetical protein
MLAEHGAEVDGLDAEGKSPIDLAMGRYPAAPTVPDLVPMPETVALLEALGATRQVAIRASRTGARARRHVSVEVAFTALANGSEVEPSPVPEERRPRLR